MQPLLVRTLQSEAGSAADDSIEIMVVNDLGDLEPGQRELSAFCARLGVEEAAAVRIEVIFEELVSNAIRHGFTAGSGQSVRVRATARRDEVALVFEDDGVAFNPLELARPRPFDTIENAAIGGLGVAMVMKLATSVRYEAPAARSGARGFRPRNRTKVTVSTKR